MNRQTGTMRSNNAATARSGPTVRRFPHLGKATLGPFSATGTNSDRKQVPGILDEPIRVVCSSLFHGWRWTGHIRKRHDARNRDETVMQWKPRFDATSHRQPQRNMFTAQRTIAMEFWKCLKTAFSARMKLGLLFFSTSTV